jgi:hypothetical protein
MLNDCEGANKFITITNILARLFESLKSWTSGQKTADAAPTLAYGVSGRFEKRSTI